MKCKNCGGDMTYLISGRRSREHEEDYPEVTTLSMCPRCNVVSIDSPGYTSWWVPDYVAQARVGAER